ncbi:MAG: PTS sugar transporter subunit IIA [Pseudomonadota bacterium]
MNFTERLKPDAIILPMISTTKDGVLQELVNKFASTYHITNPKALFDELRSRESLASTFLPNGLALPHARSDLVKDLSLIIGVAPNGISDRSESGNSKAKIFCLFFSPANEKAFAEHLKFLSQISSIFSEPNLVDELSQIKETSQFISRIKKREEDLEL